MIKVSVIMGVYNGEQRIEKALHSILEQSYQNFEVIVCDDGSTDKSIEVIQKMADIDKRIKLLTNRTNLGLAKTLNKCLGCARGEYIARMDDDDYSHRDRFLKQVEFLNQNPRYAIVGSSRNLFDDHGIWGTDCIYGERTKIDIFKGHSFPHPSVMMRKSAIQNVGGYSVSPETQRTEDYDLWCKMYSKGNIGFNLSDILLDYYESSDSYKKRKFKYRLCHYQLVRKWRKEFNLPLSYHIYALRPLLVGLLPVKALVKYHQLKFKL